jgi:XTP/dITP diphosphohydrolase
VTESTPTPPPAAPPAPDEPVADPHRSNVPSDPAEIRRKLLFGAALVLSLLSVYAGLLGWGKPLQYGFTALAVASALAALVSGATGPPRQVLLLATTNPGKLREIRDLLQGVPFHVRSLEGMAGIPAPEETGATFEANAALKARYYAAKTGLLAVADDSGIEIDAMDGRPGVLSARYPGATYEERFVNIWREMAASGRPERSARFVCAIALATPDAVLYETRGTVEGEILPEARGTEGFGYDPIFFSPELGTSLGEASLAQKQTVSHRGRAFTALKQFLIANAARPR